MKAAIAKMPEADALQDLGRATLRIVHDLKNQLNGIKLYATFLRKRLERDEHAQEERETVAKLIAGLDRAARDMTALVRYAQPLEVHRQPQTDLSKIVLVAARQAGKQTSGLLDEPMPCHIEDDPLIGAFDAHLLAEAFSALTHEAWANAASKDLQTLSLHARRKGTLTLPEAFIEWRGLRPRAQVTGSNSFNGYGTVYAALAARVIAAHGGRLEFTADAIRVSLPILN
jgi:light-regulated signal transduction histidine kinase (bacteriophytochrome)